MKETAELLVIIMFFTWIGMITIWIACVLYDDIKERRKND